ncbi:MAG: hypothetical protein ABIZ95_00575 [Pyrinomonadaceae bacterium]
MIRTNKFAFLFIGLVAILTLSSAVQAQRGYSKAEVDRLIKNAENRSDEFVGTFDRSLDRSRLNNSEREDQLNRRAQDLEKAFDDLRSRFDRTESYLDTRDEARKCLNIATDINVAMRNNRLGTRTENAWVILRNEMNTLARVYNLPLVGSRAY